jgi:hypothetical protein
MTQQQRPIAPSPELIKDWHDEWNESDQIVHSAYTHIAIRAAQWGADQELEACIAWFDRHIPGYELVADRLRTARRPKPPSLKEQALAILDDAHCNDLNHDEMATIRRALEQLPDNE